MNATNLITLAIMVGVFYLLLIRPQQRRLKQHQSLVSSLQVGDEVVTVGGMYGFIKRQDDSTVWLEISDGVVARYSKQAISRKITAIEEDETEVEELPPAAES